MRALVPVGVAAALLFAAPAAASADVIFDPADADDLAATLAEATASQDVCYGWNVSVSDPIAGLDSSVGSNLGAGQPVSSGDCQEFVEFTANVNYTSESSESEDSATYDVTSSPGGPTRADLDALGLDMDGLTGEDPDVVIGNAVTALPLLAADAGMAQPIAASPQEGNAPADARLTDSPGSDWWRNNGGMLLWGLALMAAGALFAWWVWLINRKRVAAEHAANERATREAQQRARERGRRAPRRPRVPQYVQEPPTAPEPAAAGPVTGGEPAGTEPPASVEKPPAAGQAATGSGVGEGLTAAESPATESASPPAAGLPASPAVEPSVGEESAAAGRGDGGESGGSPAVEPSAGEELPAAERGTGGASGAAGSPVAKSSAAGESAEAEAVAAEGSAVAEPAAVGPAAEAEEPAAGSVREEAAAGEERAAAPGDTAEEPAEPATPSEKDTKPSVQKDKE